jgi:adenylylsulfate kinase-like enzyme
VSYRICGRSLSEAALGIGLTWRPRLFRTLASNPAAAISPLRERRSGVVRLCNTGGMSVIFLSGPIGAGKTAVAKALVPLLPAPLSYIEGDTFWSFIAKNEESELRDTFPVVVRSMTAAALPFARSGFRVLIDFSIPPTFVATARKILKEVPFDFVLLRPSFEVCAARAASRKVGAINDFERMKTFYARFEEGTVEPICDDTAAPESLARQIADGLNQGRFRVL